MADRDTDEGLDEAIRSGVEEVRYRNGVTLAWLRIGLRAITLALWLASLAWVIPAPERRPYWSPVIVNVVHLAIGAWVAAELLRRRRVRLVLATAACVDLLVVAFAGWNTTPGDALAVGFLMGVMELMLLFSALTLPRWQALVLGGLATVWEAVASFRAELRPDLAGAVVVVTATFAVAVTWAGTRIAELASRRALDAYTGRLVREHRDELARANLEIAAQRDRVLAAQAEAELLAKLVVHDLKNPIAALLQFVSLAQGRLSKVAAQGLDGPELQAMQEDLRLAAGEGQRLSNMVGDLLLISRLEAASLRPVLQATPVRALLEQVAHAARPRAEDRQVTLAVTAAPDLLAPLDLDMVLRLLENLVSNALRFVNRAGRMELAAEVDGTRLVLAVRNTGLPVADEVRPHLFQKHGPGDRRQLHNAGLGLYLSRLVAEAHGGSMALVDAPGWSAAFEARFPLRE